MPDIGTIDLTNLSLVQLGSTLLLFAALDTGVSVVLAVIRREFSFSYVLDFLRTHVLKVATPILALGVVGHGIEGFVPAIPAASLAASASLAAYAAVTLSSIYQSFQDSSPTPQTTGGVTPQILKPVVETTPGAP